MNSKIPEEMRAVVMASPGGPEVLGVQQIPIPRPGPGKVLVKVSHIGVNQADLLMRDADTPLPLTKLPGGPGMELAGTVVEVGEGVVEHQIGDRVCGLTGGNACAEYALVPHGLCFPIPDGHSNEEAAALTDGALTIWHSLFDPAVAKPGHTLLIHGGTSGISIVGIILARAFGIEVIATAGSDKKCAVIDSLGVTRSINYRTTDFVAATQEVTEGRGADVVLDMVGGPYLRRNIEATRAKGTLVMFGIMGGQVGDLDVLAVMTKNLSIRGSSIFFLDNLSKTAKAARMQEQIWPLLPKLPRPIIDSVFTLEETAAAQQRMAQGGHSGKILISTG